MLIEIESQLICYFMAFVAALVVPVAYYCYRVVSQFVAHRAKMATMVQCSHIFKEHEKFVRDVFTTGFGLVDRMEEHYYQYQRASAISTAMQLVYDQLIMPVANYFGQIFGFTRPTYNFPTEMRTVYNLDQQDQINASSICSNQFCGQDCPMGPYFCVNNLPEVSCRNPCAMPTSFGLCPDCPCSNGPVPLYGGKDIPTITPVCHKEYLDFTPAHAQNLPSYPWSKTSPSQETPQDENETWYCEADFNQRCPMKKRCPVAPSETVRKLSFSPVESRHCSEPSSPLKESNSMLNNIMPMLGNVIQTATDPSTIQQVSEYLMFLNSVYTTSKNGDNSALAQNHNEPSNEYADYIKLFSEALNKTVVSKTGCAIFSPINICKLVPQPNLSANINSEDEGIRVYANHTEPSPVKSINLCEKNINVDNESEYSDDSDLEIIQDINPMSEKSQPKSEQNTL